MLNFDPNFLIPDDILRKCADFANNSVFTSANTYARRQQFNLAKITKDIKNGKVAEEAVYQKLVALYPDLTPPDHQIYAKKDKSWSPDLSDPVSGIRLAVKSQDIESALAYGESWIFQFGNNGKYDCDKEIFKNVDPNSYTVFVALNVPKRTGAIRAIVKTQWLHDNHLFRETKKENLRGHKLAVYFDNLARFSEHLWQL